MKKVKTIFGRRWNSKGEYWEVPYGHESSKTTETYTHFSKKKLSAIKTPLAYTSNSRCISEQFGYEQVMRNYELDPQAPSRNGEWKF